MTNRVLVGKVTEEEKKEVEAYFEHFQSVTAFVSSLSNEVLTEDPDLYEKFIQEAMEVVWKYQSWWAIKADKYLWPSSVRDNLFLDFTTNEVFIS